MTTGAAKSVYTARFGLYDLVVADDREPAEVREMLTDALNSRPDVTNLPRDVTDTIAIPANVNDLAVSRWEPLDTSGRRPHLAKSRRIQFDPPLRFELDSPIKNQTGHSSAITAASTKYAVSWDGSLAIIVWQPDNVDRSPPEIGGQTVEHVLSEVLTEQDLILRVQPCRNGCSFSLVHTNLWTPGPGTGWIRDAPGDEDQKVRTEKVDSLDFYVRWLERRHGAALQEFSEFKNRSLRLLELEEQLERMSIASFGAYVDAVGGGDDDENDVSTDSRGSLGRLLYRSRPIRRSMERWRSRGRARLLAAQCWMTVAQFETVRREWRDLANRLELLGDRTSQAARDNVMLFGRDIGEVSHLQERDLGNILAGVEHTSSRLDAHRALLAVGIGTGVGIFGGLLVGMAFG